MKNKTTLLIIASIIALLALSFIQGYLISNTYKLEKTAFIEEVKQAISKIDDSKVLDSMYSETWGDNLGKHLSNYKNKNINKDEVVKRLKLDADSINKLYNQHYIKDIKTINLNYDIKFQKGLKSLTLFQDGKIDTIYSSHKNKPLKLFGEDFNTQKIHNISNATWYTEIDYSDSLNGNTVTKSYGLEAKTTNRIEIKNWQQIVLRRLTSLLISSLFIFLFVIGLFYYSIKNIIKQKKIDEIKTDFINNITHELKTPLATLSIASKSLKNKDIQNSPKTFNNSLDILDRQNIRLQKLIDQVMTNSLSSKDIILNKDQVVDNIYFENLLNDFKLAIQHKEITIKNEVLPNEVLLRIDTFHFTTALLNILDNAVKYGNENIEITIKTELKNSDYIIHIQDNGIGISEPQQQQIFNKFHRVSEGNIHNVKGLGLGLYYTSQIIKAHNGSITTQSKLGLGTTFTIKTPIN